MYHCRMVSGLSLVMLCAAGACLSADSVAAGNERYTPRVLIQGMWGSGPNEFGLDNPADHPDGNWPFIAPNALTVDGGGNVYVLDPANRRIKMYGRQGAYVSPIYS